MNTYFHGQPVTIIQYLWIQGVYCARIEFSDRSQQTVPANAVTIR